MDSEHDESADGAGETPSVGAGAQLRAAREALRVDLAQVAAETRIPVRHLQAIESGQFEALPSRAYAIGFSRTFAKAVGLDPVKITDAVRSELADGTMRRAVPGSGMEPGDPARLPSAGLAWAGAIAALVLAVGAFAFYSSYFGAGTEPGSLLTPAPDPASAPVAQPSTVMTSPDPGAVVVLTALEDGVWLRLYEEGGERLLERTLRRGEAVTVPATATDPRINTGRPDALEITVGGKPAAKLADRAMTLSNAPVSAAALLARKPSTQEVAPDVAAAGSASAAIRSATSRPAPVTTSRSSEVPAVPTVPAPDNTPAPAAEPSDNGNGEGTPD
jgi:cytoskeletal protein RodZ